MFCLPSKKKPKSKPIADNNSKLTNNVKEKNQGKRYIIVTRHGERTDRVPNPDPPVSNRHDPSLTYKGIEESKVFGKRLAGIIKKENPALLKNIKIIVSPYYRTLQTLKSIIKGFQEFSEENHELELPDYSKHEVFVEGAVCEKISRRSPASVEALYSKKKENFGQTVLGKDQKLRFNEFFSYEGEGEIMKYNTYYEKSKHVLKACYEAWNQLSEQILQEKAEEDILYFIVSHGMYVNTFSYYLGIPVEVCPFNSTTMLKVKKLKKEDIYQDYGQRFQIKGRILLDSDNLKRRK